MDQLNQLPCALLITDEYGIVVSANSDMLALIGKSAADCCGIAMEKLFPPAGRIFLQTHIWPMLIQEKTLREIYLNITNALGERTPVLVNCQSGIYEGEACYYWLFFVALERSRFESELLRTRADAQRLSTHLEQANTELKALHLQVAQRAHEIETMNRELAALSRSDPLTGLGNRRALSIAIGEWQAHAEGFADASLLLLDVDHFKTVNDEHGHDAGDLILVALARTLEASLRPEDLAVRYGGEEFAMWLPYADRNLALFTAHRVHKLVEDLHIEDKSITVSIGIATLPNSFGPNLLQQLIEQSDKAVYQAKSAGRNRTVFFE